MEVKELPSFPPNSNPFHHDLIRQGTSVNKRIVAMFYGTDENNIILVDTITGKRVQVKFEDKPTSTYELIANQINVEGGGISDGFGV